MSDKLRLGYTYAVAIAHSNFTFKKFTTIWNQVYESNTLVTNRWLRKRNTVQLLEKRIRVLYAVMFTSVVGRRDLVH